MSEAGPGPGRPEAPDASRPRRREIRRTVLLLALMLAGTFAAWQIVVFVLRQTGAQRGVDSFAKVHPRAEHAKDPCSLKEMLSSPLKAVGLVALDGDPDGVAPPPGARRLEAFQRRLEGQNEQRARYVLAGSGAAATAAEHYRQALPAKGFAPRRETKSGGVRWFIFGGDKAAAVVCLRGPRPIDKIESVEIILTITRVD